MSGEWNMLAVTYNRTAGEVAHYVNGNQISLEFIPEHAAVPHALILVQLLSPIGQSRCIGQTRSLRVAISMAPSMSYLFSMVY